MLAASRPADVPAAHEEMDSEWEEQTRVQPEDVRRALEIRDEVRAVVQQTLDEALAPLHFAVRDLERRLAALERSPPPAAPPANANVRPAVLPPAPVAPSPAPPIVARTAPADVYAVAAAPAAARPVPNGGLVEVPRISSVDLDVRFDGTRRRRRIIVFFVIFLLIVFGALFGALISSRV